MASKKALAGETARTGVKFDAAAIGSSGLGQHGGYVHDEFLKELQGLRGVRVYREMADNDPIVGAVIYAVSMLVRQAKWTVQACGEAPEEEIAKEFVESVIEDMNTPIADVVDEATSMFTYGFAPMEIVWKKRLGRDHASGVGRSIHDDGKIGIRNISLRAQSTLMRWEIDPEDDSIDGMWQQPLSGPAVFIPIEKMLLFRTTTTRSNPEGRSLLRTAYRAWFFKKKLQEIEAIGVERDLAGLPVGLIPSELFSADADPDQKATLVAWQNMVRRVKRDEQEGILIPSDRDASGNPIFDLKLLSTAGSRAFDTTKIIDRYDRAIATSVLADFIFLGQQAVGSFALSSDKTALFATAIGGFLDAIATVFNKHLLPRLWALNNFDPAVMPKLVPGDLEKPNLAELASYITSISGAGAPLFPDRDLENHLREAAGLPPAPEEGVDMITPGMPGMPVDFDAGGY